MVFFCKDIESGQLDKEESNHCSKVLRAKISQEITLFDGKGSTAKGILTTIGKQCTFEITSREQIKPSNNKFSIAIAPPKKSARLDFMIEKLVELGAQEIFLINTQNSERNRINQERVHKQVLTACKQSLQFIFPLIHFDKRIEDLEQVGKKLLVCHCQEENQKISIQNLKLEDYKNSIFLIGPEGDFSPTEIKYFGSRAAKFIDLGNARLRTETAAIYVTAAAKQIFSK